MSRATKIVATIGPASSAPDILERMIVAGVDVVRLNFSPGQAQDHIDRARLIRATASRLGKAVAMRAQEMADEEREHIRKLEFELDRFAQPDN